MNPYKELPARAFWSPAVAQRSPFDITELWEPRFAFSNKTRIATFGSCFAQHFGRALRRNGWHWMDYEPAPVGMETATAETFGYGVFSSRTTNIYTTSLLRQWLEYSLTKKRPQCEDWTDGKRWWDPLRPSVEPDGFASKEEMLAMREQTLTALRRLVEDVDVFVFTLGLTESWFNTRTGFEYQICPGTHGGQFDGALHKFHNQNFDRILKNIKDSTDLIRSVNANCRFLFTVSPVPLTATMSGNHVLVATMASKSILRAVTAQVLQDIPRSDYFPSYEIINSPAFRGMFFQPNMRNVHKNGVDFVMKSFFAAFGKIDTLHQKPLGEPSPDVTTRSAEEVRCEEELLNAFSEGKK